ncbi:MAG TPA: PAS domain-containing protein, partial [Syntrophorhabdales bacterium]|nr:PAS domain-containing protein [Syntrophorhabdales bacterium]
RVAREFAQATVDTVKQPLVTLSDDLRIVTANRSFYRMLGLGEAGAEGKLIYEIAGSQLDIPELRRLLEQILPKDSFIENYAMMYHLPGAQQKKILLNARTVITSEGIRLPFILMGLEEEAKE